MDIPKRHLFLTCLFLVLVPGVVCAKGKDVVYYKKTSDVAPNFVLLDHEGKSQELYYYSDQKAVVLFWQGNGCPIVRKYVPTINELHRIYKDKGVAFLMVNANPQDDRWDIQKEVREFGIEIPVLEDSAQVVTKSLGVQRTGEAILIDTNGWGIVYRGAIDDSLGYGTQKQAGNDYLKDAIEAVLSQKPVQNKETVARGCLIDVKKSEALRYKEDIAPILAKKCAPCHSPEGVGPWSMDVYESLKGWGPMMREVIMTRRMPPFKPDPYYGHWRDDISLKPDEVRILIDWIDGGMVKESKEEDPLIKAERPSKDGWHLGKPDFIAEAPIQDVPASGSIPYRYSLSDYTIPQDMWVKAIEIKTSNPKVTHHVRIRAVEAYEAKIASLAKRYLFDKPEHLLISGYGPGRQYHFLPDDTASFLPKGGRFFFEQHYNATGKPETELTKIGIFLAKGKPKYRTYRFILSHRKLVIDPGQRNKVYSSSRKINEDIKILRLLPHAHMRGRHMSYTIQYPDGNKEILLSVPEYDFNWQHIYSYETPKFIPAGSTITFKVHYDNSAQNWSNPDPSSKVRFGFNSEDEMLEGIVDYTKVNGLEE